MVHEQKLTKIGNSLGIILPKELLQELNLNSGSKIVLEKVQDKVVMSTKHSKSVSPVFLEIAEKIGDKYAEAFKELAS